MAVLNIYSYGRQRLGRLEGETFEGSEIIPEVDREKVKFLISKLPVRAKFGMGHMGHEAPGLYVMARHYFLEGEVNSGNFITNDEFVDFALGVDSENVEVAFRGFPKGLELFAQRRLFTDFYARRSDVRPK